MLRRTFLTTFSGAAVAAAQSGSTRAKVVLISLDGFPAYALEDPQLPIPTLRRLMKQGMAGAMTSINPTVTWPNHTAMVTGVRADEHGVLANGTILRTGGWPPIKVDPYLDKEKMVHAPTIYDAARKAGLTTAAVNWVAINNAAGINWHFREWADTSGPLKKEMLAKGVITPGDLANFMKANILHRDQIWTRAGAYLIETHQADLLLFHLLTTDSRHHTYGPKTMAGQAALAFVDGCVDELVRAVKRAGLESRTTYLVVSDHGFKAYRKQIKPNTALEAAGLGKQVYVLPEGGTAFVYIDKAQAAALTGKVREILSQVEGIDRVIGPEEYAQHGLPHPDKEPQFG